MLNMIQLAVLFAKSDYILCTYVLAVNSYISVVGVVFATGACQQISPPRRICHSNLRPRVRSMELQHDARRLDSLTSASTSAAWDLLPG